MIVAAYSERIYKDKLSKESVDSLQNLLINCNDIKIKLYNQHMSEKININNLTTTDLIKKEHTNTYYACMLLQEIKGIIKGQQKLKDVHIDTQTRKIEEQKARIEKKINKLQYWRNMKSEVVRYLKEQTDKSVTFYRFKDNKVFNRNKVYSIQEFEWFVEKQIKRLKHSIYISKNRLNRFNQKLQVMQNKIPVICFGSKGLFKKQYTLEKYIDNHNSWYQDFFHKRHHHFTISGNANFTDGSKHVRYNQDSEVLSIMSHKYTPVLEGRKNSKAEWFYIPCKFKYREAEYLNALKNKDAIAYEIIDKKEYFIIKAIFNYGSNIPLISDASNGVSAIDINIDRFALIETDKHGNLINRKVFYFNLNKLTSAQSTKVLQNVVKEVSTICMQIGKPVVIENIKKIKFKNTNETKETSN